MRDELCSSMAAIFFLIVSSAALLASATLATLASALDSASLARSPSRLTSSRALAFRASVLRLCSSISFLRSDLSMPIITIACSSDMVAVRGSESSTWSRQTGDTTDMKVLHSWSNMESGQCSDARVHGTVRASRSLTLKNISPSLIAPFLVLRMVRASQ